ncbi:MAG: hypothetical protein HXY38_06810 [Chloroflexi bacterium]|nr:hypothetical protein [Chloroflexota bacterium]
MQPYNESTENDNELADFTDRLLSGKSAPSVSTSDEELLSLQKTVLRLHQAFPPEPLEDAKVKQMLVRLKSRMKREEQTAQPCFWRRFFDIQSNPQMALLVAAAAVVVLVIVSLPALQQPAGSSVSGAAFSKTSLFTVAGLAVVLFVIYWFSRRK